MQLKKKLSLILACVVSICCLNIGAVAVETQWDNNFIEITQGTMRATKTFKKNRKLYRKSTKPYYCCTIPTCNGCIRSSDLDH